jgi:hypothetical protein
VPLRTPEWVHSLLAATTADCNRNNVKDDSMTSIIEAPVELSEAELDQVTGGKITQTNRGGNEPGGVAVGIPATNPAGNEPPGQQPVPPGQE